jgi:hypothetical protein
MAPKGKRKPGLRIEATPELIEAVLNDLARGLTREWACGPEPIDRKTSTSWTNGI